MRPDQDPEVKLQIAERRRFVRANGRAPHNEYELSRWLARKAEEARLADKEATERLNREQAEQAERKRTREQLVASRKRCRALRPEDYVPPTSLEQFERLLQGGQSYFEGCRLTGEPNNPLIINLDLECVNLSHSEFHFVRFSGEANLCAVDFRASILRDVKFEDGCKLTEADFNATEIENPHVEEQADITGVSFQFAKFKGVARIQFDRNYLANAIFYKRRIDAWFSLSSSYAGIWQFINIALFAIYFGAVLFRTYLFGALAKTEELATELAARAIGDGIAGAIMQGGTETITAWTFVFGDRVSSVLVAALFAIYQAFRLYLTVKISPLIESERQTGYTPDRVDYMPLVPKHHLLRFLGVGVLVVFCYEIYAIFQLEITLPSIISSVEARGVSPR